MVRIKAIHYCGAIPLIIATAVFEGDEPAFAIREANKRLKQLAEEQGVSLPFYQWESASRFEALGSPGEVRLLARRAR
jgi:hypothetical protein